MRPQDVMLALATGDAKVVDTAAFVGKSHPHDTPPAVTEAYQRQIDLG